ncbi:aldolase [Neobacillus sp. MM2021_6]|uniref:aldolase n=1 Tax=Bacillaceae TaxID=186817 RepID=UPI00140A44E5|nr:MULTISPECIES: aldolase [Bacillaceae]MBO0958864.1 aldolase [Neobacillus sp. MM2021_6]NHC17593.1 aldolase [Bacillus sp. MM2020_4]
MIEITTQVIYKAFGYMIKSEIPFPELPQMNNKKVSIDLEIKIKDLSKLWLELSNTQSAFVVNENLVMFQVPNIATFCIMEGKKIIVSPLNDYDEDIIRLYLLGTCMGAILLQRRVFPLHGSALAINGKAYAIIGESGAGKSTLASAFLSEGYQLLSDDVLAVSLSQEESIPFVTPSYPQQKLWKESLSNFGMDANDYNSIFGRETKYSVPVSTNYFREPLPLAGVFELIKSKNTKIEIRRIEKMERFYILFSNTFRNFLIRDLGLMNWHFQTSANIVNKIDIYQLKRPVNGFSATELVSTILNAIEKGE